MSSCCVLGCRSRELRNRKVRFYVIPHETERRNLWLQAIQRANGSDELEQNAVICGAHFISGDVSVDPNSPDYVPSLFPHSTAQKGKRKHGSRPSTSSVETDKVTPLVDNDGLSEEVKKDNEEDKLENGVINIKSGAASNLQRTSSHEVAAAIQGTRTPVILLKSLFNPAGAYRCDRCKEAFTDVSQFVKHNQQHNEEQPSSGDVDVSVPSEISQKPIMNEPLYDHILKDELPFKCNMCERAFSTGQNLKRHKLLHVKDGRKCRQCGVLFCRRHNHVLFRPKVALKSNVEEPASIEVQPLNVSPTPETIQKDVDPKPNLESDAKSHIAMPSINQIDSPTSSNPENVASPSNSDTTDICPLVSCVIPDPNMLDPSRPPSPKLIKLNRRSSVSFKPNPLRHHKYLIQPHLPVFPYLQPALQMFSPQYLTSSFLEVNRNYACIFRKRPPVSVVKEEPYELPVVTPSQQQ